MKTRLFIIIGMIVLVIVSFVLYSLFIDDNTSSSIQNTKTWVYLPIDSCNSSWHYKDIRNADEYIKQMPDFDESTPEGVLARYQYSTLQYYQAKNYPIYDQILVPLDYVNARCSGVGGLWFLQISEENLQDFGSMGYGTDPNLEYYDTIKQNISESGNLFLSDGVIHAPDKLKDQDDKTMQSDSSLPVCTSTRETYNDPPTCMNEYWPEYPNYVGELENEY